MEKKLMRANDALEKLMEKKNVVFTECNKNLAKGESVEEASTWAWRANKERADQADLIVTMNHGTVVGVVEPTSEWRKVTHGHCKGRIACNGNDVSSKYTGVIGANVNEVLGNTSSNPFRYGYEKNEK